MCVCVWQPALTEIVYPNDEEQKIQLQMIISLLVLFGNLPLMPSTSPVRRYIWLHLSLPAFNFKDYFSIVELFYLHVVDSLLTRT